MYRLGISLFNLIEIYDVNTLFIYFYYIYICIIYRKAKEISQNWNFVI